MERDSRRDRGQWRGCHTFQDIIDVDGTQKRSGGLTMGETYFYFYEIDGSTEIHDPSKPSTSVCPYLPGQTVNTLEVPIECAPKRLRSASMNSIRPADFKTMDPQDKFAKPRPAPPAPNPFGPRLGTSAGIRLNHKASSRSLSPAAAPSWTGKARRLFGLRPCSRSGDRGRTPGSSSSEDPVTAVSVTNNRLDGARSTTPSEGCRSRDMSPESLRRFLSDNTPLAQPVPAQSQTLIIPDDIVEENEDDDNFATSAVSEVSPFTTLSPPPFQRTPSSPSTTIPKNESTTTIVPISTTLANEAFYNETPSLSDLRRGSITSFRLAVPGTHFPYSAASSTVTSPASPHSLSSPRNNFSFFDDLAEDDEMPSAVQDGGLHVQCGQQPFTAYSLPHPTVQERKQSVADATANSFGSPELIARTESGMPIGNTSLLALKGIDAGLDDLVNELSWIANAI
ncbi:hypothetical protein AB5N19_12587 [Seiridium cardinale]